MAERKEGKRILRILVEVVLCLMIAIVLVGIVQQFFLAPVAVTGSSMMPTINSSGDKVFVQKKFFKIDRGDVVVFYRPNSDDVTTKNPANSISISDFFNSLPFVNKIPKLTEESDVSKDYTCVIKRVIGIPGDHIEIRHISGEQSQLLRNGEVVNDFLMYPAAWGRLGGVNEVDVTVEEGDLFVLGDNRNNSYDSEDYGCIRSSWLMGRVLLAKIGGKYKRNL